MTDSQKKEVFLDADKEIPGQHYCCLSFISPNKVLADKNHYFFSEFMRDYEIQYKVRATESFVMSQMTKLQESLAQVQSQIDDLILQHKAGTISDDSFKTVSEKLASARAEISVNVTDDLKAHVSENMSEFTASNITESYNSFMTKNRRRLEEAFFEKNEFRTTVQGIKIRGTYDTYNEAAARAKTISKLDNSFNVYVGQVGHWLPWDPEPADIQSQEYADDQLNELMKKYKENEATRDEFFEKEKAERLKAARIAKAEAAAAAAAAPVTHAPSLDSPALDTETTLPGVVNIGEIPSEHSGMFASEDLAIARKRELAAAKSS